MPQIYDSQIYRYENEGSVLSYKGGVKKGAQQLQNCLFMLYYIRVSLIERVFFANFDFK